LALTEQGAVLGVLGLQIWARPVGNAPGPEAKESDKWLQGIDQARQVVWETAWTAGTAAPVIRKNYSYSRFNQLGRLDCVK
jgi:hypothetical protein